MARKYTLGDIDDKTIVMDVAIFLEKKEKNRNKMHGIIYDTGFSGNHAAFIQKSRYKKLGFAL